MPMFDKLTSAVNNIFGAVATENVRPTKTVKQFSDFSSIRTEGDFRQQYFRAILNNDVDVMNKRVVDLGAGPCKFSLIAREFGADVTAVDGRVERVPHDIENQGVHFVHEDIREFNVDNFDIVIIFGLLYHLNIEDQIRLLRRCQGKIVLIDTEVHRPDLVVSYPQWEWKKLTVQSGEYEGVVYPEKSNHMASIGNKTSFWHTETSYLRLFKNSGFNYITVYRPLYLSKHGMRCFYLLK